MRWQRSDGADPPAKALADRHYPPRSPGRRKFTGPGRNIVLRTPAGDAVWSTAWPQAEFVRHAWAGAWINTIFRSEGPYLASELITEAVAASRWLLGEPPELGIVTFVDADEVASSNPGYCYLCAGWKKVGVTKVHGHVVLQQLPDDMPNSEQPLHTNLALEVVA